MSSPISFDEMLRQSHDLPLGDAKVALFASVVREADFSRGLTDRFAARLALIRAAGFSGHIEQAMPAFAWCVAQYDCDPDKFREYEHTFMWYFKNVLGGIVDAPQIDAVQAEKLLSQMAAFYQRAGYSLRTVIYQRFKIAVQSGSRLAAQQAFTKWLAMSRDAMSDCQACENDTTVEYYELIDDLEKSIEAAQPNLQGRMSCQEVPHRTFSIVLRPLALLGRYEEADEFQRKGYRLIRGNRVFLQHIALHMFYLFHRGRVEEAVRMLERHLAWALTTYELRCQFYFYLAAETVCRQLAEAGTPRRLQLPKEFLLFQRENAYVPATLADWFSKQREALGVRFDARNGTAFHGQELPQRLIY